MFFRACLPSLCVGISYRSGSGNISALAHRMKRATSVKAPTNSLLGHVGVYSGATKRSGAKRNYILNECVFLRKRSA
jgi:hypothetical protein